MVSGKVATALLLLPWLNPIAGGPTPSVMPWLVSAACFAGLFLLIAHGDIRWDTAIRNSWLLAALVSSGFGLLQYFDASAFLNGWVNSPLPGVAYGNLRQRNQFATLLNIGLIALVCLALRRQTAPVATGTTDERRPGLPWMGGAAVLLAVGNAASVSRTGLLQLAGILAMAVVWRWWKAVGVRRMLLLAVLAYVVASVALPLLASRDPFVGGIVGRFGEDARSCQSRLVMWRNVLHLIDQRPWFGWGWGELDFAHFMTLYPGERFCDILDNAHNLPLHLAVELGMPVAAVGSGVVAWLFWRLRPHREMGIERQMAWSVLALIALHSLLEYPLWYGPFQLAVGLSIWILWRMPAHQLVAGHAASDRPWNPSLQVRLPHRGRALMTGLAVAALVLVTYAMWDYQRISQIYQRPEQRSPAYRVDTLAKVHDSWLFRRQVQFAELTLTQVDDANADRLNAVAWKLLHFSPEPRVIEKLIDTTRLLGRDDEAESLVLRYQAAFPADYARWAQQVATPFVAPLPP